jgi:hypothetical protein
VLLQIPGGRHKYMNRRNSNDGAGKMKYGEIVKKVRPAK